MAMIRFLISEMWSVCSNVLTGMMYNWSAKYFCPLTWEIFTARPSYRIISEARSCFSWRRQEPVVALYHHSSLPAPHCWIGRCCSNVKNFSFDFQSILLPHFLAPDMCYTEDVVKALDQIVNDNLEANIYIQFQFPENKTLDFYQILACWESI